jgi:DNA-directed RNA polymerase specialized sigma24 family protein
MNTTERSDRPARHTRTAALMAAMANREPEALSDFITEYRPTLATIMRGHLADMGWVYPPTEVIDDLVVDATLELWTLAPAWRVDGGAAPWVWASKRLRRLAASYLGQHSLVIDESDPADTSSEQNAAGVDEDPVDLLRRAVGIRPDADVFADALRVVASDRDQRVFLDMIQEVAGGNRRPSITVAASWSMTPSAVRKVVERVRWRLNTLASVDDTYAGIVAIPALRPAA